MTDLIYFDMCVNDDNGNGIHTGKLRAAKFGSDSDFDFSIHFDCVEREMTCRKLTGNRIRVGRQTFRVKGYSCYVGNMMWDAALVDIDTANAIAGKLRDSGKYQPTDGATELWDRWDSGEPLFQAAKTN